MTAFFSKISLWPLCLALLHAGPVNAFWGKDFDEPPPIVRLDPPNLQEVQKLQLGNKAFNDQVVRYGLAPHTALIPDWSEKKSGKLLASWNPQTQAGKHPTVVIQHGGVGGPGATDWGHARWFYARGFHVLILDSFWSRGFIANWRKIDADVRDHGAAFSTLGANTRARDAFAAARWLREHEQVDPSRIFLIGGSEGGWSWQRTPGQHGHHVSETRNPKLGPFYAPVLLITVELEPPGSATDIHSCNPNIVKWASRHVRLANTTHAFDAETPPENPVNRCWYSANPHWCTASGGRDPLTGNCRGAPKADFCSDTDATKFVRHEMLKFLSEFKQESP